ncbi:MULTISPECIES: hypothetical protein [Bacillales]|uniref:YvrJ family protein n=1 Tax=Lysinibacillus louembei TaxID=1470088 RepID=A0ABZ0RWL3_9BACI|nr:MULTISPECIES: hypothetical protein [Bacillales]MCT6922763.1 hypothetical protein [Metasolibacillus sp.]MCT6938898.1 hypothetical protein [Metasolibacillus sp.]WPK11333.1 hypothetical protein R6U77_15785 [Lysinibacillus louembei]
MTGLAILPLLIIYVLPIIVGIWFAISLIKLQRERNMLLKEVVEKLSER